MMKSRRHELNTMLNDYSEQKYSKQNIHKIQQNPLSKKLMNNEFKGGHYKSNSVLNKLPRPKLDNRLMLSEYSEFLAH